MKGIVLAGGTGSRLWPLTRVISKQLLPIYDKPMIYYPIATLMHAGVKDILVITTPQDQASFIELLNDGSRFGINLEYAVQSKPEGLAQALIIGEEFLESAATLLILGDNIFHGVGLGSQLKKSIPSRGAHIFTYEVADPTQYGVMNFDPSGTPISVEEKPKIPQSNSAITGLYYFDKRAPEIAKEIKPSPRGELEITSLISWYLDRGELSHTPLSRGTTWLDTGNVNDLNNASNYVRIIEERTGLNIGCLEEIALNNGWINRAQILDSLEHKSMSGYYRYLREKVLEN